MRGVNKVILIGNLGKDPDVQYLESGVPVAKFSLATSENYKDKNGNLVEQTEWHNIVLWRGLAEIAQKYMKKGSQVYVEGKIRTRSWEDKETKAKKYITEIVGDNITLLDRKASDGSQGAQAPAAQNSGAPVEKPQPADEMADDLPF